MNTSYKLFLLVCWAKEALSRLFRPTQWRRREARMAQMWAEVSWPTMPGAGFTSPPFTSSSGREKIKEAK